MKKTLMTILAGLALTACASETKTVAEAPAPVAQGSAEKAHAHGEKGHKGEKGQKGQKGKKRDLSGAAATLGVSEDALRQAMRDSGRPPNLAAAAASLGVSEADLRAALPARPERPKGTKPKSTGS